MTTSVFLGMNYDTWISNARSVLKVLGGVAVALGVSDAAHLDPVINAVLDIAGSASVVAGFFWSLWHHTPDAVAPKPSA